MLHAYTGVQFVERPTIDGTVLENRGWASFTLLSSTESVLREQLLGLAANLGTPVASRSGGNLSDTLMPTEAHGARAS